MNHDNCDCVGDLIFRLGMNRPVWPVPDYCQDIALIAYAIHRNQQELASRKEVTP